MDAMICKLDGIDSYKNGKKINERNNNLKSKGHQIARIAQVDFTKKILNEPMKMASEGSSLIALTGVIHFP